MKDVARMLSGYNRKQKGPYIRFSNQWPFLLDVNGNIIRKATVLAVMDVNIETLPEPLIGFCSQNGSFRLPDKGRFLLILMEKGPGIVKKGPRNMFADLRPFRPERKKFYKSLVGKTVDVIAD